MALTIFENYYQLIQVEPTIEPQPLPEPEIEVIEPVKKTETQTIAANNRLALEKKWDANKPTPQKALDEINKLPQPKSDNVQAVIAFKKQRKQIADDAIRNLPSKFEDFSKRANPDPFVYLREKTKYDSQIKQLKQISVEAGQYPKQILTPDEAVIKINELPRPDRNNPAEIKKYNQARANIADAVLMYNPQPPKREDFTDSRTRRFSSFDYQGAVKRHHENISDLKEYSQDHDSSTPPPINDSEAEKAAAELIKKYGGTKDAINEDQGSALGKELATLSKNKSGEAIAIMNKVQDKLSGTEKGDNVAAGFLTSLSDKELENLAKTYEGQDMLKDLKPRLLSGKIYDSEREQAARIDFAILKQDNAVEAVKQKVEKAYKDDGYTEAAKVLRDETADLTPEETAVILKEAKPTIDKIIGELNDTAGKADDSYDYTDYSRNTGVKPTRFFDQTLTDLTAVIGKAAKSPNGAEIVKELVKPIVEHIKKEGVERYDEALGKAIGQGGGADLTVEIIKQLKAAGKVDEANDILENVKDGIKELKENIEDSVKNYAKESQEFQWLVSNWGPMMDEKELQNAINGYMKDHPEIDEKFKELDELTGSLIRSLNSLEVASDDLKSLDNYDDVQDAVKDLTDDKKIQNLIISMPSATEEISNLVKLQTEGKPTLLDEIKEPSGLLNGVKGFGEKMANVLLKATVNSALEEKLSGNQYKADQILDNLTAYSDVFGFGSEDFSNVIEGLKKVQESKSEEDAKKNLENLNTQISKGSESFVKEFGSSFNTAGAILSLPGLLDNNDIKDPLALAENFTDYAGLSADSAVILSNAIKNGTFESIVKSSKFENVSKKLSYAGILFDGISLGENLIGKEKDQIGARLDAVSIAGTAAAFLVGGVPGAGIGIAVFFITLIGDSIWGAIKESKQYETETTEKFLRDGGINSDVAQGLRNQDGAGNSPGAVFRELAKATGVDPKEFFDYLNTLSADEVQDLVKEAHKVKPGKDGKYEYSYNLGFGQTGEIDDPHTFDLGDLRDWMKSNGYEDAPEI